MYVCMSVCMYVCMYTHTQRTQELLYAKASVGLYVCLYVYTHAEDPETPICKSVCRSVCIHTRRGPRNSYTPKRRRRLGTLKRANQSIGSQH